MKKHTEKGNVISFILVAVFLTGLLIAAMTQGARKDASTQQLDEMALFMQSDVKMIQEAVSECVQSYTTTVDVNADGTIDANDNPNPPFPLYSNLSSGAAGEVLTDIKCPGAPTAQQTIFTGVAGGRFKLIGDTAVYTTRYFSDATEGVYVRITRAQSDPLWTETISRLNGKYSACTAAAVTSGGVCANGCFYYWILRRSPGGGLGGEAAQPTCG